MGVKVGDKVRSLITEFDVREGEIYEVDTIGADGAWVIDDVEDDYYLCSDQYEPVAVAGSNGNRFKVGDRVRLIKDGLSTTGAVGKLATIDSWGDELRSKEGQYLLKIDPPVDYKTLAVTPSYTRATPDCFELADAPLTIRAGRYYRTRDGRKVGPMRKWYHKDIDHPWEDGDTGDIYSDNGTSDYNEDIIAEWTDEPVAAVASSNADIFDDLEDWMADNPLSPTVTPTSTTGFTVPLDAPEFGGATEFKVGDRVNVIYCAPTDNPGTVEKIDGDRVTVRWDNHYDYIRSRFHIDELRLVAEATTAQEPPTSIADIVRRLERLESAMWQHAA